MDENWGMLGHEWAVDLLRGHLRSGSQRHAYLLTGSPGLGRRSLGLRFAQALNCTQPPAPGEFCGECRPCQYLARMQHPDLSIIEAEEEGGTLRVEGVRELSRTLALAPYEARYRIGLLLRFEEANPSAANALLKTLEEPPPKVVLLLTAESAELLLPTIVSRCEVLRLRPLPLDLVEKGLQSRWAVPPGQARLLAHLSAGRPGYALRLFQDPALLERRSAFLQDHAQLLAAGRRGRFDYAAALSKDKERLRDALQVWLSYWRDVLLRSAQAGAPLTNLDLGAEIDHLAGRLDLAVVRNVVAALESTLEMLRTNANPRLATEILLLDLPRISLS